MNNTSRPNGFWRIGGPLLAYLGIRFVTMEIMSMLVIAFSAPEIVQKAEWKQSMTYEEAMELVMQLQPAMVEVISRYQVQIVTSASLCTLLLTIPLFIKDRKREKILEIPVNKKAAISKYIWVFLLGIVICVGANGLSVMSNLAFMSEAYQESSQAAYAIPFVLQILCMGIIIPITEELIFRGVLYRRFREKSTFFPAALAVSLLFGWSHGNIVQLIYGVGLGMLLVYVYEKYGSLKAPILLHVTANLVSIMITETKVLAWLCSSFMRMAGTVILCAFAGAVLFVLIQKIDEKPENVKDLKDTDM